MSQLATRSRLASADPVPSSPQCDGSGSLLPSPEAMEQDPGWLFLDALPYRRVKRLAGDLVVKWGSTAGVTLGEAQAMQLARTKIAEVPKVS